MNEINNSSSSNTIKITFINHASFLLDYKNVRIVCDPWLEGTAFDDGWKLLSETKFKYEDFKDTTHIWFSHEHPDHFSPPNLLKIPLEYRKNIDVLYQETVDRKVIEFCKKGGFKSIVELKKNQFHKLHEDFEILSNPFTYGDSYAIFKTQTCTLLNLNDCVIDSEKAAEKIATLSGPIDILFTQFGYANKVGNTEDRNERVMASNEKLERIRIQHKYLKPKTIVPFASYIYFCHEDNSYMNNGVNKIDVIHTFIENELKTKSTILYPNDIWKVDEEWDSKPSIVKYMNDYDMVSSYKLTQATTVNIEKLKMEAKKFTNRLTEGYMKNKNEILLLNTNIYIVDYKKSFSLLGNGNLTETELSQDLCDISLHSAALYYSLKHLWGGDTLHINGRYQTTKNGNINNFRLFFEIASRLNRGESFPPLTITSKIADKLKRLFIN